MAIHEVTNENKELVKKLASRGMRHVDIAARLKISEDTLTRRYRDELDYGRAEANFEIASTWFEMAKSGNVAAAIFWMKTRAGWRETGDLNINMNESKKEDVPQSLGEYREKLWPKS